MTPMQEKFEKERITEKLLYPVERDGLVVLDPKKVKAWIGRAEIESNAKARIEAYDNVFRLAYNTSHKQYAKEQIDKLNKVIDKEKK